LTTVSISETIPLETADWLCEPDNPAVAVMTRRDLLGEPDSAELRALWGRRNEYPPVAAILDAVRDDGTWLAPERDYKKYEGNLWQIHFLGELYADGSDPRIAKAAEYAFSRQLDDGSWSCNGRQPQSIPCLTANVARALARLGYADDPRVIAALAHIADLYGELGYLGCRGMSEYSLNGYCHMLTPKILLFLGEVPRDAWPRGSVKLRDACLSALRDKEVFRSLPAAYGEFKDEVLTVRKAELAETKAAFLEKHQPLEYREKKGWLRLGYPLSYNSDALDSLLALAAVGEKRRAEYQPAIEVVTQAADDRLRWKLGNTFNGKMLADVETKGQPSKWVTLRALLALEHFGA
jgi:hypothetical protein